LLLLFPFFFADLCMVDLIGFIYLILQFAPILIELNCEIVLLHIRMLLLDLLDPLHDLRLENLSFNGADHLDPFTENSSYTLISAHGWSHFSFLSDEACFPVDDITLSWRCEDAGWPGYATDKPGIR